MATRTRNNCRPSRRDFIKGSLGGSALIAGSVAFVESGSAAVHPAQGIGDLILVNGKFVDGRGVVGSAHQWA